jgi:hypothetical protein
MEEKKNILAIQAKALWSLHKEKKLIRQTIRIGMMEKEVLYSHLSKFAIDWKV